MAERKRPTNLRLLAGTPKAKLNDDQPQPDDGLPECPAGDALVREIWDDTVRQLQGMQLAMMPDVDVLLAYCQTAAVHRKACEVLESEGVFIKLLGTTQPHPAIRVQKESATLLKQLGNEFGLSPAARTKIKVSPQQPKKTGRDSSRLLSG